MTTDDDADIPLVESQTPAVGTTLPPGGEVSVLLSLGANPTGFAASQTIISQYANSPTILQLIESMSEYFNPSTNLLAFYNNVWNIDSAIGFGLDIWGRILGVGRLLQLPLTNTAFVFGFDTGAGDRGPFNQAPFDAGGNATQSFALTDTAYRTLLLLKAFVNVSETTIPALNSMLQTLFAGRGRCYVQDYGSMAMAYAFEFALTPVEYAILTQTGIPPHPAGVMVSIVQVDLSTTGVFGFDGSGLQPFNQGTFYSGA